MLLEFEGLIPFVQEHRCLLLISVPISLSIMHWWTYQYIRSFCCKGNTYYSGVCVVFGQRTLWPFPPFLYLFLDWHWSRSSPVIPSCNWVFWDEPILQVKSWRRWCTSHAHCEWFSWRFIYDICKIGNLLFGSPYLAKIGHCKCIRIFIYPL